MALLNGDILWHLFWVVPVFIILFVMAWQKRKKLLTLYLGERSSDPAFVSLSPAARFWRMISLLLVLFFLFLAAARPFWGNRIMPYTGEGRDLLIVFDVSRSMLAQDVRPSRMEHAKYLVRELVKLNPTDRFGLIAFAGKAFLECPMTMDKTSFLQNVNDLDTTSIPVGGTNIEEALKTALSAFKAAESPHLAIILITDGDELTGESSRVVDEAIRKKIPLFIAGIGDPSQPAIIQIKDEKGNVKTLRDNKGNAVNSQLNEKQLGDLAARTGGIYVRSGTTSTGIAQLEARIKALDSFARESGKQYRPIERPLYPLAAALFFFFLFLLFPEKRRKGTVKLLPVLIGAGLLLAGEEVMAQAENTDTPSPVPAVAATGTDSAPVLPESTDPYILYNEAHNAQFEEKDFPKAEKLYQQAINFASDKEEIRSGACLNLGVLRHTAMRQDVLQGKELLQKQDLQKALEKVKEAIQKTEAIQELYKYGLLGATREKAAINQQLLLNEKREAEKLQKEIEELLKKQQQAQQNTQQALNQQKQQQKQQDQQKKEQKKEETKQQTSRAQKSVEEMKDQAKKLDQKQMEQQAQKAENELKQAMDSLKKGEDKKAEKHLEEALKALGEGKQDKDSKNGQDKQQDQKNKDNKKDQKDKDQKNPQQDPQQNQQTQQNPQQNPQQQQNRQEKAAKEEKGDYDKKQAEALLDLMQKEEKDLKDALKKRMLELYRDSKVEKDW
ncbi:MAG: VWA domain-containing protein [Lentisphaeria bacterium]|nr:VWA domain-containing protein [Lentisphaeria bacterium]